MTVSTHTKQRNTHVIAPRISAASILLLALAACAPPPDPVIEAATVAPPTISGLPPLPETATDGPPAPGAFGAIEDLGPLTPESDVPVAPSDSQPGYPLEIPTLDPLAPTGAGVSQAF